MQNICSVSWGRETLFSGGTGEKRRDIYGYSRILRPMRRGDPGGGLLLPVRGRILVPGLCGQAGGDCPDPGGRSRGGKVGIFPDRKHPAAGEFS